MTSGATNKGSEGAAKAVEAASRPSLAILAAFRRGTARRLLFFPSGILWVFVGLFAILAGRSILGPLLIATGFATATLYFRLAPRA